MKYFLLALLLLILPLIGCIENTETPKNGEATLTPVDQQQNTKIISIEKALNELATGVSELSSKIGAIPQQSVSKTDIDSLNSNISTLQSDISELKAEVIALKNTQSSTPYTPYTPYNPYNPVPTSQGVTFTTTPSPLPQFSTNISFQMRISNALNVVQYVKPTIMLQSSYGLTGTNNLQVTAFSFPGRDMTTPCWSIPMQGTATNYFMVTTLNKCGSINTGEIAIPANGYTDVNVGMTITNSSGTYLYYQLWTVTVSLYGHL